MILSQRKLEEQTREKSLSVVTSSAITGFFGGAFWGTLGFLANVFHFTDIHPNVILEPWSLGDWKTGWIGTTLSIFFLGLFGIVAAYIYYFTLKKFENFWVGIFYGLALFLFVFFILNPLFPSLNPITELTKNTIITTLCLFVLFGVFIGYSISYDYHEMLREKGQAMEGKGEE
ncbi:YqhR family membrane protein [Fervidibacillus halotolerans]|uniref:YqhR family membrane protein n=1 Tax=Fervidibacillus halotolerans TaxID=2980027 RepID=A0A9E8M2I1_9BACI|nr:YqhR family membrane protein [Fervidibacillus halotolerans]WAA13927.1 YqhR family membrane protein [Fervidibacillus halotolerans]